MKFVFDVLFKKQDDRDKVLSLCFSPKKQKTKTKKNKKCSLWELTLEEKPGRNNLEKQSVGAALGVIKISLNRLSLVSFTRRNDIIYCGRRDLSKTLRETETVNDIHVGNWCE